MITESPSGTLLVQVTPFRAVEFTLGEAVDTLEAFARTFGYTLIDRQERRDLTDLAEVVEDDAHDPSKARALAAAVSSALKEV